MKSDALRSILFQPLNLPADERYRLINRSPFTPLNTMNLSGARGEDGEIVSTGSISSEPEN
ncbi:hypothetical protein, partial [Escherichia coli]|uniref:hypothetical protein n=1 Tax=Escherichia coli TaxID=562 RepID=UPI001F05025B